MHLAKTLLPGFFLLALSSSLAAKDWKTLTIGTEAPFAPWATVQDNGSLEGFDVDFSNQVCGRAKITCKMVALSYDDLIPSLVTGKIDVIVSGFEVTERRQSVILF